MEQLVAAIGQVMKRGSEETLKVVAWACIANGFKSIEDLEGAPTIDQWWLDNENLKENTEVSIYSAAHKAFLSTVVKLVNNSNDAPPERKEPVCPIALDDDGNIVVKKKKRVSVDIGPSLSKISMEKLSDITWPAVDPTSEVATEMKDQKENGIPCPCPYIPMEKFAPSWACLGLSSKEAHDKHKKEDFLEPRLWPAAANRWALAMHAAGALSYTTAIAHVDVCMRAAHEASGKGNTGNFGKKVDQWYDRLRRQQMNEKVKAKVPGLDVDMAFTTLDRDILEQAIARSKEHSENNFHNSSGKSKGKGKGKDKHSHQQQSNYGNKWGNSQSQKRDWNASWPQSDHKKAKY